MKSIGKCGLGILILVFIFSFLSLTALSPSKALAANAEFDVKKMGDMSDFDPNTRRSPPGTPSRSPL